jgi:hypothetical protein
MSNISFTVLEKVFAPIEAIGHDELVVDAGGTSVTLRVLLPEEENNVQRWASEVMPEENRKTTVDAMDYLERFKVGILSYAIIGVSGQDLHDVDFVETGETLPNGAKVKVSRNVALRGVLFKWSGALRTRLFNKYAELLKHMETRAEEAIVYEPSDLDTEIERLEIRLKDLKNERDRQKAGTYSGLSEQIRAVAALDSDRRQDNLDAMAKLSAVRADASQQTLAEAAGIDPNQIDPTQVKVRTPGWEKTPSVPPPERIETAPAQQPPVSSPVGGDSFVNASDPDALAAEAIAETNRLVAMRRRVAKEEAEKASVETPQAFAAGHRPPHLDAAETVVETNLDSEELRLLRKAREDRETPVGTLEGAPVYKMPSEPLERKMPAFDGKRLPLNSPVPNQGRNPRFQPPRNKI